MHNQRGMTFFGVIFSIFFVVIVAFLALKIIPSYYKNYLLTTNLQNIVAETTADNTYNEDELRAQIKAKFDRQLTVESMDNAYLNNINIKAEEDSIDIQLQYTDQVHLLANIDLLIKFNKILRVKR